MLPQLWYAAYGAISVLYAFALGRIEQLLFFVGSDGLQDVIIYNVPDDPKKKNRGFTFLDFDCHKTAAAAKKRLATCRVFGCDIIVDWADPLEEPDEETMAKACDAHVKIFL